MGLFDFCSCEKVNDRPAGNIGLIRSGVTVNTTVMTKRKSQISRSLASEEEEIERSFRGTTQVERSLRDTAQQSPFQAERSLRDTAQQSPFQAERSFREVEENYMEPATRNSYVSSLVEECFGEEVMRGTALAEPFDEERTYIGGVASQDSQYLGDIAEGSVVQGSVVQVENNVPCCRPMPQQSLALGGYDDPARWIPSLLPKEPRESCQNNPFAEDCENLSNENHEHANNPDYTKADGYPFGYDVKDGCSEDTWDYGFPHSSKNWNNPHLRTELPHHSDVQSQLNGQRGGLWGKGGNGGLWGPGGRNGHKMKHGKHGNQWGQGKWKTGGSDYDDQDDEYDNYSYSTAGGAGGFFNRTLSKVEGGDNFSYEKATHHCAHRNFEDRYLRNEDGIEGIAPREFIFDNAQERRRLAKIEE